MASAPENNDIVDEQTKVVEDATDLETVNARHRRERKELQSKIQAIKKTAPKNNKSKRKEVMEQIAKLETEMDSRHAKEILDIEAQLKRNAELKVNCHADEQQKQPSSVLVDNISLGEVIATTNFSRLSVNDNQKNTEHVRISKAQRRRDKKALEARQLEAKLHAELNDDTITPKMIEAQALAAKLKERRLRIFNIPSDGDCLYNAIRHQLMQAGLGVYSVADLRDKTGNYIEMNKAALIHYMTDPQTGNPLNEAEFLNYCKAIRKTAAWGGQIELKVLSSVLKVPIEVVQGEGPNIVQGSDEFKGPNLIITYHRYLYSLGEHYNSTVPLEEAMTNAEAES